jgi:protein ImuB
MSRIVSVWLPRWPIKRFLAAQAISPAGKPIDPERPFVLAIPATGGLRIAAMNEAAEASGIVIGDPVADARAKADHLQVHAADGAADDTALRRLALWATRYTPTASPWAEENGADGFFLDIEGAAHLFGGEENLLADLAERLDRFGLPARLAIAETAGVAWALSHFEADPQSILPAGDEAAALAVMPIEALRLSGDTRALLRRLGFKSVGVLLDKPRAPFAARFADELLRRLDQALGRRDEPLIPVAAPPVYLSLTYLLEPIVSQQAIIARACRLMHNLVHVLIRDDVGARALRLSLYGVDGTVEAIDIGLTAPTRSVPHVARLIDLKLETLTATHDGGFGFEAIGLAVTRAEPMPARQLESNIDRHPEVLAQRASKGDDLNNSNGILRGPRYTRAPQDDDIEKGVALIDALRQRLGPDRVRQFEAFPRHIPECAETLTEINDAMSSLRANGSGPKWPARWQAPRSNSSTLPSPASGGGLGRGLDCFVAIAPRNDEAANWSNEEKARPLLLLPHAEPTEVTALIPEGPPRRFRWRGVTYDITGAQGPERIADEWWRAPPPYPLPQAGEGKGGGRTRDYYLVEDGEGRRFWLYREGLYGRETATPRWFVHGLFA